MLKTIYTIAENMREKDIYIYGINRDSITVFTNLALWGGDISGFVDDAEERYIGEYFMNRSIVSIEQVINMQNAIVVVPEVIGKSAINEIMGERINVFYYHEIIAINEELRDVEVYLYGIGGQGEKIYKQCCDSGIKISAACVTTKCNITVWNDLPVREISEIDEEKECAFIIATVEPIYREQMLESLEHHIGDKYVLNYMLQNHIHGGRFFQIVGKAVAERKKIWLYGRNKDLKEKVTEVLLRYSVKIQGELENLYDLAYDSIDDVVVIITDNDACEVEQACDILDSIGFALECWNYTSLANEVLKCKDKVKTPDDLLLGWSNTVDEINYPGFFVHGNNLEQDIKIMILGGSTSTDGIFRAKSWVTFFYEKLIKEHYPVTIFNGAAVGHPIVKELLHLLRDGAYLGMDYVITLSGVNNTLNNGIRNFFTADNPGRGKIYGLESKESRYEFWHRNIKIMKSVAELYGAKLFAFLQPMPFGDEISLSQAGMHEAGEFKKGALDYKRRASLDENKSYINAIDFFGDKKDMFIDTCHYSEAANKLIADLVYEAMVKEEGKLHGNYR